ncbi:ribonucleoside-diphosphate reductase, adenosylcobalamin-dependent [Histomonas meleagridis]|uniref:ribonucleoside-diphosphate reductase, adenosylcobalamin-dependent n=1 Tax=Histomonas meleagridis TaxID=135588 RepID=UPI00355975CA|nr:ribonucleoside-diphosphate reductase, adenosylcobalamin-dependent [Histomonas meleagridis]KAH0799536.1 ribonucleoside-diphosphate reductase, adenosylcobalamin-dependent [Histomonas meleagridis]
MACIKEEKEIEGIKTKLDFSSNAMKVLKSRYLQLDDDNNIIETPEEMFSRVGNNLASIEEDSEKWGKIFTDVMMNFEFIPAGRTLANAGSTTPLVSNCVVLHMEDSLDSIFETLKEATLLQQAGSGIGFPFHLLRPAGFKCKRTLGVSSGPLSFLRIFSEAFQIIQQHGRRGANMAVMSIEHPDVLEFIEAKAKDGTFENFNFSVSLTNEFMEKVINNDPSPWLCKWNGEEYKPRYITRDSAGRVIDITEVDISAPELMNEIIHSAWRNGEPGCVFIDNVNKYNPLPGLGPIECCNPCGEQFLHSGDACNLGSINLEKFVNSNGTLKKERLAEVTRIAVRMLDNVVDLTQFPVERVNEMFKNNRRIGLGIMGLADMLFLMKLPYNSDEGMETASEVMKIIQETAIDESVKIGEEKGNFPNFEKSVWKEKYKTMRNASLTNIAPTGSTAMLMDVSSGVEPYFALAYRRGSCLAGKMKPFVNKHLKKALKECGCYSDEVMEKVLETGTLKNASSVPEEIRKVFVTSLDIEPKDHIKIQSTMQKYCCNAISKTINFKNDATEEMVKEGFIEGWKNGCKGLTVYRNGSRQYQVLEVNGKKDEPVKTFVDGCKDGKCDI